MKVIPIEAVIASFKEKATLASWNTHRVMAAEKTHMTETEQY